MNDAIKQEAITITQQAIDHVNTLLTDRGHAIGLRLGEKPWIVPVMPIISIFSMKLGRISRKGP